MTFKGELYEFQEDAVKRMLDRGDFLIAHRMGLGKTVTSIAAIEELVDAGEVESSLIIAPASIKWQWKRQIDKFSDGALIKVIEGTPDNRRSQYRSIKRGDYEYTIMNYEQVVNDWDIVRLLPFDGVVCDEATAIKNPGAARSRHIKRLQAPYKFGLTGQPIENKPEDLFSIMQWVDRDVLGEEARFDNTFIVRGLGGQVERYRNLRLLRERMAPVMDRKTRKDVADQLPALVEQDFVVDFDPAGQRAYRKIANELLQVIMAVPHFSSFNLLNHYAGVTESRAQGDIMKRLMALRMLCDHPELMLYSADKFDDPDTQTGSQYASELRAKGDLDKLKGSPKMNAVCDYIQDTLAEDRRNKICVFSFFKPMLDLLNKRIRKENHCGTALFTGDFTAKQRDAELQRFSIDPNCRVFLSSDAGGVGVDLPMANYLIEYDLPWSAGKREQRRARIDRISSAWPEITLATFTMRYSIEERMLDMLEQKSAIAAAWLDGKGVGKSGNFILTLGSLSEFLQMAA